MSGNSKDNLELENQRKLDEERTKIQDEIVKKEAEKSLFREAQLKKQLGDALRANEDMRRKLEQGSQQLQGEVLELELEDVLRETFRTDEIEPVSKGIKGADVIQKVRNASGHYCGSIIWETQREKQIQKVVENTAGMYGNLQGIIGTSLPQIRLLELPFD